MDSEAGPVLNAINTENRQCSCFQVACIYLVGDTSKQVILLL